METLKGTSYDESEWNKILATLDEYIYNNNYVALDRQETNIISKVSVRGSIWGMILHQL